MALLQLLVETKVKAQSLAMVFLSDISVVDNEKFPCFSIEYYSKLFNENMLLSDVCKVTIVRRLLSKSQGCFYIRDIRNTSILRVGTFYRTKTKNG